MAFLEIIEGVGLTLPHIIMIGTFGFGLIIAAKEFKIAAMVWTLMFMGEFIMFYQYDSTATTNWYPALIAFMISIVLLILMLFGSYSKKARSII